DGPFWTCKNGMSFGLMNGVGPAGSKYVAGTHYRVDVMASTGLYEDGKKGIRRPTDPKLRALDMERDGVDAEVIYGILGAATRLNDPEAANEMFQIYNDWLVEFCRHDPSRFIGLACLPYGDIDAAGKEIYRVGEPALRGTRRGGQRDLPRGEARPARHGAVVFLGHGADVAPRLGAALEGRERREPAPALPHLPGPAAGRARQAHGADAPGRLLHRGRGLSDEPGQHPRRHRRRGRARALSERAHRLRRERHRLEPPRP